jgi:hypothetical protein
VYDHHVDPVVTRLGDLASSHRTGALRLLGDLGGVIYLRDGNVVYANSKRTPGPAGWLGRPLADIDSPLERNLAICEATIDAALELLSGKPGHSPRLRFQPSAAPDVELNSGLSVSALLAEVTRRQRIVAQLAVLVTADSTVTRGSHTGSRRVRVSAEQWALLIRIGNPCTPRGLAAEVGRSVFATTIEVSRLVALRLLSVADSAFPLASQAPDGSADRVPPRVSFLRAVTPMRQAGAADRLFHPLEPVQQLA